MCPEGASLYAAAKKLRESGFFSQDEWVVLLNTGAGIKYPDSVHRDIPVLKKDAVLG